MPVAVLIVDDDDGIRDVLPEVFRDFGYFASSAAHPSDAATVLTATRIDVLLADVLFADGTIEPLLNTMIDRGAAIPTVLMTAGTHLRSVGEVYDVELVAKPFDCLDLERAVRRALVEARIPRRAAPATDKFRRA